MFDEFTYKTVMRHWGDRNPPLSTTKHLCGAASNGAGVGGGGGKAVPIKLSLLDLP